MVWLQICLVIKVLRIFLKMQILIYRFLVAEKYESTLKLTYEQALEMAKYTKGYPFAFQVLGYLPGISRLHML